MSYPDKPQPVQVRKSQLPSIHFSFVVMSKYILWVYRHVTSTQPAAHQFEMESTHWAVLLLTQDPQSGAAEQAGGVVTLSHRPDLRFVATNHTGCLISLTHAYTGARHC